MEIISRISKGSKMDQIYIPKNRQGFPIGNYVLIKPLSTAQETTKKEKPLFYNIKDIEPIKLKIITEVFELIGKKVENDNIIITGSFLDKGFCFNDLDIILITGEKIKIDKIKEDIEKLTGIKTHILLLDNKTLALGLSTDPLYQLMLSKCISKKRIIYKIKPKINYKLLDLHLLKSKTLLDNFDILNGNEKFYLTRNLVAILLFIQNKRISKDEINKKIKEQFNLNEIAEIKENTLNKKEFLIKYKEIYDATFNLIMENIKNGAK